MAVSHAGFCKVCAEPTHQIDRQHPIGHPLAGRPLRIGKHKADAVRANLILSDGTWTSITIHQGCLEKLENELPRVWQSCLETFRWEYDNRALLGARPLTKEQQCCLEGVLLKMASVIPLGVMCVTPLEN